MQGKPGALRRLGMLKESMIKVARGILAERLAPEEDPSKDDEKQHGAWSDDDMPLTHLNKKRKDTAHESSADVTKRDLNTEEEQRPKNKKNNSSVKRVGAVDWDWPRSAPTEGGDS